MFLFLSQVMDDSSQGYNAPLYKLLIAVFSKCLHHNYMLKKACRVSINVSFVTVKGERRVPVSWRETVTQSAIESPAVLLLRPHRDEVWIFHNRSFEGLQELLVWLNIQWTATHILTGGTGWKAASWTRRELLLGGLARIPSWLILLVRYSETR